MTGMSSSGGVERAWRVARGTGLGAILSAALVVVLLVLTRDEQDVSFSWTAALYPAACAVCDPVTSAGATDRGEGR